MQKLIVNKLKLYALLIRLDKPIGIYLLLWPTLWALVIAAEGSPDGFVAFVFILGVFLMRSAGCAINDYADREIDKYVTRTKERPLTAGLISPKEALMVFVILSLIAFVFVLFMNTLTIILSLIGVILAGTYPFMKRHHYLPQVHLGAAFGWAVPMAFAAQSGEINKITWLLYVATLLWTIAYDTIYGMVDREDDLKIGVKSTAILFGEADRLIIGILQAIFLLSLVFVGIELAYTSMFYWGIVLAAAFFVYQQMMIFYRLPEYCFPAFLNNHWVGAIIFFAILSQY